MTDAGFDPYGQQPPTPDEATSRHTEPSPEPSAQSSIQPSPSQPLPICDYTTESEEPCEEPATVRRWSGSAVVTGAALGAVVGGILVAAGMVWALGLIPGAAPLRSTGGSAPSAAQTVTISTASQGVDVAEAVAAKAVPSVVNVTIEQQQTDPFTGQSSFVDIGNGSGVILRSDGYILTNNHVVEGADRVLVSVGVANKEAKVIGVDPSTDLAVIKVDGTGYPAVELGTSKNLRVGQWVMAVGSPFGLEKTVTSGIISALQRSEQVRQGANDLTTYTNLIQTDAAINPGNSGGALVDEQGRLVGINTLIQSPSGGVGAAQSAGIGFALPVDFAASIANQLITTGKASHPYLGVSSQTIDQSVASQYGLPIDHGVLISFVQPNGPAEKAGLRRGDIVTKIGDMSVASVEDVFAATRQHKIGDKVTVEVVRNGVARTMTATLGSDASAQ
jgi:putative serine protease PepD